MKTNQIIFPCFIIKQVYLIGKRRFGGEKLGEKEF